MVANQTDKGFFMIFLGFVIHFFVSGFVQFYYASTGFRQDGMMLLVLLVPLIAGVYFLGWLSLLTFFFGMMFGGFVFVGSKNKDDNSEP